MGLHLICQKLNPINYPAILYIAFKIMNYDFKIKDLLFSKKNLVPNNVCEKLINLYEKYPSLVKRENSYKYDVNAENMDNYGSILLNKNFDIPEIKEAAFEIFEYIKIMLKNYENYIRDSGICPHFNTRHISMTENMRILKYEKGAKIGKHTDMDKFVRGSLSIQLNDGYEGGDLKFFNSLKKPLEKGEVLIFPAEPIWIHETEPVTKGVRYVMNCFLFNNYLKDSH